MARIVVVGSLNMDLVAVTPRHPHPGETIIGLQFLTECGGKGANQAYAAAKLGGDVAMLGRVGDDEYGERMRANLQRAGCDVSAVGRCEDSSGVAVIVVSKTGENSIVVIAGANHRYSQEDFRRDRAAFDAAGFLLLQLETPLLTVAAAAAEARRRGLCVILDPAPAPETLPAALLHDVDILTPNETEAGQLLGRDLAGSSNAEMQQAATQLRARGANTVILKLGARGCLLATADANTWIPAPKVVAVDSTAAGDVFNGALAVASAEGASLDAACRFAVAAAASSVTRLGAQRSMPSREDVAGLL